MFKAVCISLALLGCSSNPSGITATVAPKMKIVGKLKQLTYPLHILKASTSQELVDYCVLACDFEHRTWDMQVVVNYKDNIMICNCIKRKR